MPVRENVNFLTVIPYFLGNVRCALLKFQAVRMDKYLINLHLVGFDCFSTGARNLVVNNKDNGVFTSRNYRSDNCPLEI